MFIVSMDHIHDIEGAILGTVFSKTSWVAVSSFWHTVWRSQGLMSRVSDLHFFCQQSSHWPEAQHLMCPSHCLRLKSSLARTLPKANFHKKIYETLDHKGLVTKLAWFIFHVAKKYSTVQCSYSYIKSIELPWTKAE